MLQGKIANLTKTAKTPGGISLFTDKDKTTYKSTYQLLKEIASIYHDLTDKQQAGLLEALAGKRGGQVLAGLLDDFSEVEKAMTQISQSAGSADNEMAIIRESISYQLNALKQTWVGFLQDLIDRGVIQKFLENLTKLSEGLIEFTKNSPLLTAAGIMALVKAIKALTAGNVIKGLTDFISALTSIRIFGFKGIFSSGALKSLKDAAAGFKEVEQSAQATSVVLQGGFASHTVVNGMRVTTTNMTAMGAAANGASKSIAILKTTLGAVAIVLGVVALAFYDTYKENQRMIQAASEATQEFKKEQESLEDQISKYEELSNKLKDSNLSEEETYNIKKDLYEIQKELNEEYGTEADKLDLVNGKYSDQIDYLRTLSKEKAHAYLQENKGGYDAAVKKLNDIDYLGFRFGSDDLWGIDKGDYKASEELIKELTVALSKNGIKDYLDVYKDQMGLALRLKVDKDHAEEALRTRYDNGDQWLEKNKDRMLVNFPYYSEEDIETQINNILYHISDNISKYSTDEEIQKNREIVEGYNRAAVLENDTLRNIYYEATEAVEEYNKALATGEGVDAAKKNLERIQQQFEENKELVEGSELTFEQLFDLINKYAEDTYIIDVAFNITSKEELPETIRAYINSLQYYTDYELRDVAIDTSDGIQGIEGALIALADWLGISYDNVDLLIDKLVELGYVEGQTQQSTEDLNESLGFSDIATSVENVNKRLKSQFDALGDVYQKIFYGDSNDEGFSLDRVDTEMMEKLRTTFLQIDKDLEKSGVVFEVAPINKFLDVITSAETKSKSLAEQQQITQDAVNELATAYFYAADGLQDLNDETRDALEQQFSKMGITNAKEIVDQIQYAQEAEQEALDAFSNISVDDISEGLDHAADNLEREYQKIKDWGLEEDYGEQIKNKTIQTVFGNVDMDKRAIITWSDEMKEAFKDELASWQYDPEIGNIDTVFGGSAGFTTKEGYEVPVTFTPIMVDENGENPQFLSEGTVYNYISTVLEQADKEVRESGEEWTEEAVFQKALEIDFKGMDTAEIDSEGRIVGQTYVHGIIAGIGEEDLDFGTLMHFSGEEGAIQLAEEALETYNGLKEKIETNTLSLENVTADEIALLETEGIVSEATAQKLVILALKKQLAAGITFGEQGNIDNIIALAKAAGVGAEYLTMLARAKSLAAQVDAGNYGRTAELEALQQQIENFDWQKDLQLDLDIKVDPASTKDSAGKAGKDAADEYKKKFDEELKKLKNSYERGEITLAEYLAQYKALIEKYFSDTEKYAEERAEALHEYMKELKGYYESAISGVTTIIDHRIKAVQKQKDAALKAIEEERKAAKKALEERKKEIEKEIKLKQKQIKQLEKAKKPYQDEIEKIQKANEERKKEIELQKDLYELERLQHQRTQFIYKDGQMVYQNDPDAMREAREKVKEDEDEKKIEKLEKIIEGYDKQIELLNESIELLQEESDSIDEQIAAIDEFYDKLVEDTTKAFDAILEDLEKLKSKWEELAEIDKVASAWKDVGGIMEMLGYTVDDVLNDTPGAFDAFKEAYIACLAGMNGENDQYLEGLSRVTGKSIEELKKMMGEMENLGDKTKKPLEDASKNIEETGNKAETASSQMGTYATKVDEAANSADKLNTNTTGISGNLDNINSSLNNMNGQPIQDLIEKFESLRAKLVEVKEALGTVATGSNGDQSLGGLAGTLQSLNGITFDTLIENFNALLQSVDAVTTALGGGGGESGPLATNGGMGGTGEQSGTASHPSSGGGGLVGAIEAVKQAADDYIGTEAAGGDDSENSGEEGGGTVISDFGALKETVDNVSSAIGTEDSESGDAEAGSLVSTLLGFKQTTADVMGNTEIADSVIGIWNSFKQEVEESAGVINDMIDKLNNDLDKGGYETTLTVHLVLDGDTEFTGTATRNGKHGNYSLNIMEVMGLPGESGDLVANLNKGKFTGTAKLSGTANLGGNWAYEGGKTLIAEIGPELVVYPNGRFETFDRPQMVNLPRGSVIFNHLQTSEILDGKNQITGLKGKSNLNGTLPSNLTPLSQSNPEQFIQFAQTAELLKANTDSMKTDLSNIGYTTDDIKQAVQNITNNTNHMGTTITFGDLQFTCTGVTSSDVIAEVGNALQREFEGLALNAYQRAVNMA